MTFPPATAVAAAAAAAAACIATHVELYMNVISLAQFPVVAAAVAAAAAAQKWTLRT